MTSRRNPQAVAERRAYRAERAEFKKLLRRVRRKLRAERRYAGLTTDGEVLITNGLLAEFVYAPERRAWSLWVEAKHQGSHPLCVATRGEPHTCATQYQAPTEVWFSPATVDWLVSEIKSRDAEAEHSAAVL